MTWASPERTQLTFGGGNPCATQLSEASVPSSHIMRSGQPTLSSAGASEGGLGLGISLMSLGPLSHPKAVRKDWAGYAPHKDVEPKGSHASQAMHYFGPL